MYNTNAYSILTTTVIQTQTYSERTPFVQFNTELLVLLFYIVFLILLTICVKVLMKEDIISDYFSELDSISGKMLYNSLQEIKSYYKNNRIQMTIIFVCAIFSCFVGLTVLMISIFYFNDKTQTIGIISGTVVSFISGTFFWIYKQCNNQVQHYFNELIKIQNIFIAMELTEECNDEIKNQNIDKIIDKLIKTSDPSANIQND